MMRQIFLAVAALAVGTLALWACGEPSDGSSSAPSQSGVSTKTSPGAARSGNAAGGFALADYLDVARVDTPVSRIAFTSEDELKYLSDGWNRVESDEDGRQSAWTRGRSASVEIPLAKSADLTLRLRLTSPQGRPGLRALVDPDMIHRLGTTPRRFEVMIPDQSVKIDWNGRDLGVFDLERGVRDQLVEIEVPAEIVRPGLNRLRLFPKYWIRAITETPEEGLATERTLGVECSGIEIDLNGSVGIEAVAANAADEEARVALVDGVIEQRPGSVISYYFDLPPGARLRGLVELVAGEPESGAQSGAQAGDLPAELENLNPRVRVTLVDEEGGVHPLLDLGRDDFEDGDPIRIDEDLSKFTRRMAALSLSFESEPGRRKSAEAGGGNFVARWSDLEIEGDRVPRPPGEKLEALRGRYNIFVILFDAMRADHTSPYGGSGVETPGVAAVAESGVTFMNAFANTSWTRPSVASMLTGAYPPDHGIRDLADKLPADIEFLPEVLQQNGYRTLAIVNNIQVATGFGFGRGYDRIDHIFSLVESGSIFGKESPDHFAQHKTPEARAEAIWEKYIEPFRDWYPEKPFFIYYHELDPHAAFTPRPPFDRQYADPQYESGIDPIPYTQGMINRRSFEVDAADIAYMQSQYKGEIGFMDGLLAWFIEKLEREGMRENTLLIFLSDHGEEFMEHGMLSHGPTLYDEVLRVPLVMSLPGVFPKGKRIASDVELNDIAATIADLVGVPVPSSSRGRSMLPLVIAPEDFIEDNRQLFARLHRPLFTLDSVRSGRWKLIRRVDDEDGHAEFELYDTDHDPGETLNLWGREPVVGMTLLQSLRANRLERLPSRGAGKADAGGEDGDSGEDDEEITFDSEALDTLRALGYVD